MKIIIIGAGIAGLYAAYKFKTLNPKNRIRASSPKL